ncbi:MAG: dependent glucose-6-phosphate dehydrogenase [Thermomicrobiales bacterium]|jgi:uronate dehydrogenase|nr:dependent glucose-6-phosphate dehydrogenase [Thermomicrobiales bacterium]
MTSAEERQVSQQSDGVRRILLTGAAGRIGSAFFSHAAERYHFRLADRRTDNLTAATDQGHELIALDVADLAACQEACREIDTVVHLAADPSPEADFYSSLLENNIKGTYNIFRAAKDQGCQRVVFASSIHAVAGYPRDVQPKTDSPVRPFNMYGVSKCFGEAVAACFAYGEGLSSIAIRIGAYDADWLHQNPTADSMSAYVSHADLNQLLDRCVETPDVPFAIVHGLSNNRFKRMDISSTRDLLGFDPQDDAFQIFGIPLHD